jgi:hypothetical protein
MKLQRTERGWRIWRVAFIAFGSFSFTEPDFIDFCVGKVIKREYAKRFSKHAARPSTIYQRRERS